MAMEGLFIWAWASTLVAANPPAVAGAAVAEERENPVNAALAVQTAMQQGKEHLLRNKARAAVEVLERQLSRINGNPDFLRLLRDAYRAHLKDLRLARQDALVRIYQERLAILEPAKVAENASSASLGQPRTNIQNAAAVNLVVNPPAAPTVVRGKQQDDDDPFQKTAAVKQKSVRELVIAAEHFFDQKKYSEADHAFQEAYRTDPASLQTSQGRWAFSKMKQVVDQLNDQSTDFPKMENEVRTAIGLQLPSELGDFGKNLLVEIDKRRRRAPISGSAASAEEMKPSVRDLGRSADGVWLVAETANFRIYHNLTADWIDQVARVAEGTRQEMGKKWFGSAGEPWNPKCELYLHATSHEYSRVTGVPGQSPGHSSFQMDGGRILARRIDLHVDDPGMLPAVLPHETTHVVLAGNFGDVPVPRWADEGIAVLTEPRDKVERHLRNLPRHLAERQLFGLQQLVEMNDYPDPRYIGPFYAESVSLVEFLAKEKGPETLTRFIKDGLRTGYAGALQKYYGMRDYAELEQRWQAYAFGTALAGQGVAQHNTQKK